jgi:hypothetical protein
MRYRKLRIAWAVGWGLACVLLIVLWVRSYWWTDYVNTSFIRNQGIFGQLVLGMISVGTTAYPEPKMSTTELYTEQMKPVVARYYRLYPYGFGARRTAKIAFVIFPFWLAVVFSAALGTVPWVRQLHWRFSLRTLLIATTLVAVVLGAIVWLSR